MATTETVLELLRQHEFRRALIIDDAFDPEPQYETLVVDDRRGVGDAIDDLQEPEKARLSEVLRNVDLSEDDWESGLTSTPFLAELWKIKEEGILPGVISEAVFQIYESEREQKLRQLDPLKNLLTTRLQLEVEESGREGCILPDNINVVFLDLFLGVARQDHARAEAAGRIKMLLENSKDRERPLVILMSTETGEELEHWADELRSSASLLGAKFRVISKTEFGREEPLLNVLEELLEPLEKAQALAGLLDEWDSALERLRNDVMKDLRNFDLSDCAYLQRFRLQAEGMPLGMYLLEAYSDVLKYRLEGCLPLVTAVAAIDNLDFESIPPAHFLPNQGVNWLTHAMTFTNDATIQAHGYQFAKAAAKLVLGDIIAQKPANWTDIGDFEFAGSSPIYAVISQSCDLQQNNSDTVLLLQGVLHPRTWNDLIKSQDTRLDCFRFRDHDYVIEWDKAKLDAWPKGLADRRLKPGGTHLRIAQLRPLPALKVQQIFAANLTRVGVRVNPHVVVPVGVKVVAKSHEGEPQVLYTAAAQEQVACVLKGMVMEGKSVAQKEYLVFKSTFGTILGTKLLAELEIFKQAIRPAVKDFAQSQVHLAQFRLPCRIGRLIEYGQLKIDVRKGEPEKYKQNLTIVAAI